MTMIGPIPPTNPIRPPAGVGATGAAGAGGGDFSSMLADGIESVSRTEHQADDLAQRLAIGDPTVQIHDVTIAAAEAGLSVQMLTAVRDRAVEAYQQIINLQV